MIESDNLYLFLGNVFFGSYSYFIVLGYNCYYFWGVELESVLFILECEINGYCLY